MRLILLLPMLLLSASAGAQALEADKARYATNLFASICIFGQGKLEGPRDYVEYRLRPLNADAQRFFLDGHPGKAWASDVAFGGFVVALLDDGEYLVHVRRLASSQAEHFFEAAVKILSKSSSVEVGPALKGNRAFGEVSILQYFFRAQLNGIAYEVKSTATDLAEAPIQVTFSSKITK